MYQEKECHEIQIRHLLHSETGLPKWQSSVVPVVSSAR